MKIEKFLLKVPDFDSLSLSKKIDLFLYYHTVVLNNEGATPKQIESYFNELKTAKYSNIPDYLKKNSKKVRGKQPKFIYEKGIYHLERSTKSEIDSLVNAPRVILATNSYFPLEIFDNTRTYLQSVANQAAACYDHSLFDACSVMTRKLLEILIIETFEKFKLSSKIKNGKGNFYYLSDLIDRFEAESTWNIGRNATKPLRNLKSIGDMSAHNRRFIARKGDMDKIKDDLRIVLEELLHLIDYPNWKP